MLQVKRGQAEPAPPKTEQSRAWSFGCLINLLWHSFASVDHGDVRNGDWKLIGLLALAGWCLLVFMAGRYRADFPMHYHWDEMGKAAQIQEDRRNLRHPLFILNTTELAIDLLAAKPTAALEWQGTRKITMPGAMSYTEVTHWGRALSALWVALAVGCLALLAYRQAGWVAAVVVALLSGWSIPAVEAAHVFKEHAALLLGLSVALLGMDAYAEKSSARRALGMGLAMGLVLSTKYAAVILFPYLLWVWLLPPEAGNSRKKNIGLSLAGLAGAFVAINFHPAWYDGLGIFRDSLGTEISLLMGGHHGAGVAVPHGFFWWRLSEIHTWFYGTTALGGAVFLVAWVARESGWRGRAVFRAGLAGLALLNLIALSFMGKLSPEYLWPTLFFLPLPMAVLAGETVEFLRTRCTRKGGFLGIMLVGLIFMLLALDSFMAWRGLLRGYESDARRELAAFVLGEVPPEAAIAQDQYVGFAAVGDPFLIEVEKILPHRVVSGYFIADRGSLEELRRQGVRYVAINMDQAVHYLNLDLIADDSRGEYERRRAFYRDLQSRAALVWESPRGSPAQLQPWLRLYRLE
jgi:hypothetical protein